MVSYVLIDCADIFKPVLLWFDICGIFREFCEYDCIAQKQYIIVCMFFLVILDVIKLYLSVEMSFQSIK